MAGDSYEIELIEENAVAHVQAMVLRLLDAKQITRARLAEKMGVSQAHVSQLLGDDPKNLSIKKAARLFHALDEELVMSCAGIDKLNREAEARNLQMQLDLKPGAFDWFECANSNQSEPDEACELLAA